MADLATLKVKVDAADAVRQTKQLGDELKKTAAQGPLVSMAMGKTEAQIRRLMLAEQAAYREADKMAAAMRKLQTDVAGVGKSAETVSGSLRTLSNGIKGLQVGFAAIIGSQVIKQFATFADTAKLLEGRLRLVTSSTEELVGIQETLFKVAQSTRTSYEGTVELYARVSRSVKDLGISQKDLLKFTELTQLAIKTSGATSIEAANAVIQLSQGLAAGALRGQDFRSVMSQTPGLALAIAQGLGVTVGELQRLAEAGKLTSRAVIDALNSLETKIRTDASKVPRTISDAWEQSKNDIIKNIGEIDKALKISSFFVTLARAPGMAAQAFNVFGGVPGYSAQDRKRQEAANLAQARAMTPAGRADAAAEAERKRQQAIKDAAKAEREAAAERYKAWQEEKARAAEKAKWEMDEINRAQVLLDLQLGRQARRAGFSMTAPRGGAITTVGGGPVGMGGGVGGVQGAALQGLGVTGQMQSILKTRLAEYAKLQKDINDKALIDKAEAERLRNEQIAQNFAENMQRAFGDILTQFIVDGKFSVREIFSSIKQMGGSMVAQGISSSIMNLLPATMGPFQSILAGAGLLGLGSIFSGRQRSTVSTANPSMQQQLAAVARQREASERMAALANQRQIASGMMTGVTAGRGGVVQSAGTVLQETTASRMIGELVAIRVATTRTADAVSGNGSMAGTTVNVTVQGGMAGDAKAVGASVAEAVDRMLGSRVQALRLTSGTAVTT